MTLSMREIWTMVHGMGFGALFLLACSGALVELCCATGSGPSPCTRGQRRWLEIYLFGMAALAWMTVLTGAYVIYPWYRAVPPAGTTDLAQFPQRLLLASPGTAGWHSVGMEWKEYVAWFAPIGMTMVAVVFRKYGEQLGQHRQLRAAVLGFVCVAFLSAAIAGFFGAMLVKAAPVQGGRTVQLTRQPR
jgi:hypothetical protein